MDSNTAPTPFNRYMLKRNHLTSKWQVNIKRGHDNFIAEQLLDFMILHCLTQADKSLIMHTC